MQSRLVTISGVQPLATLPCPRLSHPHSLLRPNRPGAFVSGCRKGHAAASRRCTLLSLGGIGTTALLAGGVIALGVAAAANAGGQGASSPKALIRTGMEKFRQNDVAGSLEDFDQVLQIEPRMRPYLWQRGLSLYYAGKFAEGAKQFRDDVAVNPNDTEEAIWAWLCEAQLEGPEAARSKMLQVGRDPRPVMRAAYECFCQGSDPAAILAAASSTGDHDAFYANLYVGLWYEGHGQPQQAKAALLAAVGTQYATLSGDYMAALARVHCLQRGWQASNS